MPDPAKDSVKAIDILMELEKVFAGEVEYDECLMNLGLHTAQVRKTCPNLFHVLSSKQDSTKSSSSNSLSDNDSVIGILKAMEARLAQSVETVKSFSAAKEREKLAVAGAPTENIRFTGNNDFLSKTSAEEASQEEKPIPTYTEFAQRLVPVSRAGDEWLITWDSQAPLPTLNGPLTIRTDAGRIRFNVTAIDESLRRIRLRHVASPQSSS